MLAVAKILENMEIGHNVMHGQWDWMNDPHIHSRPGAGHRVDEEAWKHSHNYVHHTFTNILGKDRDLGYWIMRVEPEQPWHPVYLAQPIYNVRDGVLRVGVAFYDIELEAYKRARRPRSSRAKS